MLIFLLVSASLAVANAKINSEWAYIQEYPYNVAIEKNGTHKCAGSIISKNVVLTAASCLVGTPIEFIQIRSGTATRGAGGDVRGVNNTVLHKNFSSNDLQNTNFDIALVFVEKPFIIDNISRAVIDFYVPFFQNEEIYGKVYMNTWSKVGDPNARTADLQLLEMDLVPKSTCHAAYQKDGGLAPGQICAEYLDVRNGDTCFGVLGSPLIFANLLIGVYIYSGENCGSSAHPMRFTEVAHHLDWIHENLK